MVPDGDEYEYTGETGDTYEDALLSFHINPDTVLILFQGTSLPQDKCIEEDVVEIVTTCSRG
jgi:hypothetical protein